MNSLKASFTLLFLILNVNAFGLSCELLNIKDSYKLSSAIFYGRFINADTVQNFFNLNGQPYIVDNFEVIRFYKGIDTSSYYWSKAKSENRKYNVSLINQGNEMAAINFKKNKHYLIYTYRDFINGHLTTDGCTRTREIINNDFKTQYSFDPDFGKDESIELESYLNSDTTEKYISQYVNTINSQFDILSNQIADTKEQLDIKNKLIWILGSIVILLVIYLLFKLIIAK